MDKKSVLIVEDEDINRQVLTMMLQDEFKVVEAANGLEALDRIKAMNTDISLILLDVYMPIMGGFEFLKLCNENKLINKIPVILITCDSSDHTINRGFELGISDFVTKPFNYEILHRRIRNTIRLFIEQERLLELVDNQTRQIHKINNELINMNENLVRQAKQFKIASMQSYDLIIEYDLCKNIFELLYYTNRISEYNTFNGSDYLENNVYKDDYIVIREIMRIAINEITEKKADIRLKRQDSGEFAWYHVIVSPICDANTIVQKLLFTFRDIDEKHKKELALMEKAEIDMLTGILNRGAGEDKINNILTNNDYAGTAVLLMLDIDDFKKVNDRSGHAVGDKALVQMARILNETCKDAVIARFGGDEFFVFMDKVDLKRDVEDKIKEIIRRVQEVDNSMIPSVSIGADFVRKGDNFLLLMKRADMALYMMKGDGKGGYRFYDEICNRFKNESYNNRTIDMQTNAEKYKEYLRINGEMKDKEDMLILPELAGKRILVVDDNEDEANFVSDILGDCGAFVNCVDTSEVAISEFISTLTGYYDIILANIVMIGLDGYQLALKIRSLNRVDAGTIPIIAISESVISIETEKAYRCGINDFLYKPIRQSELYRVVDKYVQ